MRNEHEQLISKKATYHKNCKVHVTLKDGSWENGWIDRVGSDLLTLKLTEEGVLKNKFNSPTITLFFLEIKDIEEFSEGGFE